MKQKFVPTIVLSEGRNAGPYDAYVAQLREEKAEAVRAARKKGREALGRTADRPVHDITWRPCG